MDLYSFESLLCLCFLYNSYFFYMARQPLVGKGLHIEVLRTHFLDTPHTVGLLWTSDQPDEETT
jgi:hypothetical protein